MSYCAGLVLLTPLTRDAPRTCDARCCQVSNVSLSAPDMSSGDVDVKVSAPDLPSADVDASVSVPDVPSVDVPSVDVKAPKKGLFGKFLKKKSSKPGIDVSDHGLLGMAAVLWLGFTVVASL